MREKRFIYGKVKSGDLFEVLPDGKLIPIEYGMGWERVIDTAPEDVEYVYSTRNRTYLQVA